MSKELPKDWKWEVSSNILDIRDGTHDTPKYVNDNGIPLITSKNLKENKIDFEKISYISKEDHAEISKRSKVEAGDILFAMIGTIGNPAIIKGDANFSIKNVGLFKKNEDEILPTFLVNFLRSYTFQKQLNERKLLKGTTQKFIPLGNLRNINIPLPPILTQQAIVSKIEELFSEIENGIKSLFAAQQQLKTYRQSVLKWAFEGKLTNVLNCNSFDLHDEHNVSIAAEPEAEYNVKKNQANQNNHRNHSSDKGELPKGWKIVSIIDLAEKNKHALKAGPFGSSLKKEFYVEKGYKIYGQEQVISDNAFYGDYYINKEKYQELNSCKIKPLDILISLVGTVGKVLLLPENCEPGIINPRLIKISLDKKVYLPKFFKFYFESSFVKSFYKAETRGTTMDVLNLGIIKTIPFPLCSIEEQSYIVQEIESRLSVADKMEESITQSLQQAEALRQSILKKAFEGKLI
jgi:type I restriction enzyme, S subunit